MASGTDYPAKRGAALTIEFPMFSTSGSGGLLTGLSPTTNISQDDGSFATTTNSATEVASASGVYTLDLTAAEMTADRIVVVADDPSARDVCIVIDTATRQLKDLAFPNVSGRGVDVSAGGDVDAAVVSVGAGAITSAAMAADLDTYQAILKLTDDNSGTMDRYAVVWFKNSIPVTSGIASPTIEVWEMDSGATSLIASTAMTQAGSTATYFYEEGSNRVVSGVTYTAKLQATIDSATRTWEVSVSRDSS